MNMRHKRTVLVLDDDEINLMILSKNVQEAGYAVKPFTSGEAAWDYLESHPGEIDMLVIDKMLPGLGGMELLKRIKQNNAMKAMPVIMQTGDVGVEQMRDGLEGGAYYYLTKPFHPEILTAILHSAAGECDMRSDLFDQMHAGQARLILLLQEGELLVKTQEDARMLASAVAHATPYPEFVALGLMELLSNAIEHGNLEIGYEHKRQCLIAGNWEQELKARMENPEYAKRVVRVHMQKSGSNLHLAIRDEGKGFDWNAIIHDDDATLRLNEPNGRGIAKAMIMLDDVSYIGNGNEVHCSVSLLAARAMPQPQSDSVVING